MSRAKVILVVAAGTLLALALNPHAPLGAAVFGAPPAGGAQPTSLQMGLLMVVSGVEALAFGLGLAFLAFGGPVTRQLVRHRVFANLVWLGTVWLLVSWTPHSALHEVAGESIAKLIVIEVAFHVTLILAALTYAGALVKGAKFREAEARALAGAGASS